MTGAIHGWCRWNNNFGRVLALCSELALTYTDGTVQTIVTDTDFEVGTTACIRLKMPSFCKRLSGRNGALTA